MPFCRKCGRRLVEYSENCPDCGTSTTAPLINIKRSQGSRQLQSGRDAYTAKIVIPEAAPVKIKPPAPKVVAIKKVSPAKVAPPKVSDEVKAFVPAIPPKPLEQTKPVLSTKHIVKPKRAKATKVVAAFTIANARPVAGLQMPQNKPPAPKPIVQAKPVVVAKPFSQPEPVVLSLSLDQEAIVVQPEPFFVSIKPVVPSTPVVQLKPISAPSKPAALPKPVTPAPIYPPHEIIKSNVSLKEDLLANPQDYETETFPFDLECPLEHFWPEGSSLPVSKGKAYCPKCGERLSKPKPKKKRRHRYRRL
ncbi:MAG: hypothetical protein ACM3JE_04840 [Betaproteobacteria bacterium]